LPGRLEEGDDASFCFESAIAPAKLKKGENSGLFGNLYLVINIAGFQAFGGWPHFSFRRHNLHGTIGWGALTV